MLTPHKLCHRYDRSSSIICADHAPGAILQCSSDSLESCGLTTQSAPPSLVSQMDRTPNPLTQRQRKATHWTLSVHMCVICSADNVCPYVCGVQRTLSIYMCVMSSGQCLSIRVWCPADNVCPYVCGVQRTMSVHTYVVSSGHCPYVCDMCVCV